MRRLVISLVAIALAAVGCAEQPENSSKGLAVVAAFYPLAEAAQQIGGETVEVKNLTPPGAEPHDLELTSDQLDQIIDADLVLYLGQGFQPSLEAAVDRAEGVAVDLLEGEDLVVPPEAEDSEEVVHGEGETALDPHIWLDPRRWAKAVDRIGDAMAAADRDAADNIAEASRTYTQRLDGLDKDFKEGLKSCESNLIVTSHAAFTYLARRYGLEQESIAGISPEVEPNPAHLADLADLVKEKRVTTIYTETLVSPEVAETLARETGAQVATLNPLEGLTEDQIGNGENYESVMRENLEALRTGLGCG